MKDQILQKAGELFLKLGYKSVTMDDIAKEMGISKKTLYKYFNKKEVLVDESIKEVSSSCLQKVKKITKKGYTAIKENFEIKKEFNETFKNVGESPMYQLKKYYPEVYQKMATKEVKAFKDAIKNNIKKGIAEGSYRADVDIEIVTDFYFSLIFGLHEKDITQVDVLELERQALIYHTRAIATLKGIGELEFELSK